MADREFENRNRDFIARMGADGDLRALSDDWFRESYKYEYSYHFTWLGLPVIQYPQDIVALQEVIWRTSPAAIVETGIARGGSLIFSASMLELLGSDGLVIGVDIDIRQHNRRAIESHPLAHRIRMVEGSSTDAATFESVCELVKGRDTVLVILDSNHTHDHVLQELRLYSSLVGSGSYLIVFDTIIEMMPDGTYPDRPWGRGDNPYSAVQEFLRESTRFEVDRELEDKLLITGARGGYLKCTADG